MTINQKFFKYKILQNLIEALKDIQIAHILGFVIIYLPNNFLFLERE